MHHSRRQPEPLRFSPSQPSARAPPRRGTRSPAVTPTGSPAALDSPVKRQIKDQVAERGGDSAAATGYSPRVRSAPPTLTRPTPRLSSRSGVLGSRAAMATAPRLLRLRKRLATQDPQQLRRAQSARERADRVDGATAAQHVVSTIAAGRRAVALRNRQEDALSRYWMRRGQDLDTVGRNSASDSPTPATVAIRSDTWTGGLMKGPAQIDLNALDRNNEAPLLPVGRTREAALIRALSSAKQVMMSLTVAQRIPYSSLPRSCKKLVDGAQMSELWELYGDESGRFQEQQMQQLARDIVELSRRTLHDALRVSGVIAKRSWQWNDDTQRLASERSAVEAQLAALEGDPAAYLWKLYPGNVCFLKRRTDKEPASSTNGGCSSCVCSRADFVSKAAAQLFAGGEFDVANLVPQLLDRLVSGTAAADAA